MGQVNFASQSAVVSWQNSDAPLDVVPDSIFSAQDALAVINYINAHPSDPRVFPASDVPPPFCDVNGDGLVTAVDVLQVINAINTKATAASATSLAANGAERGHAAGWRVGRRRSGPHAVGVRGRGPGRPCGRDAHAGHPGR